MSKKSPIKKSILKLDLACGSNKQKGFIGVDLIKKGTQADVAWDLTKYPWPFKNNSVSEIFSSHYLEHIPHIDGYDDGLFHFMDECYRILKVGGTATFLTPYYTSVRAFQDPTHHRFIGETTFAYFSKKWRKFVKIEHYPIKCDFDGIKIDHSIIPELNGKSRESIQYEVAHSWNVVNDIIVTLKKLKEK